MKKAEEGVGRLGGCEEHGVQLSAVHGESVLRGTGPVEALGRRVHG